MQNKSESEVILSIEEEGDFTVEGQHSGWYEGVTITTTKQKIQMGIQSGQHCCENYGYLFTNNDAVKQFVGATVLGVRVVNTDLTSQDLDKLGGESFILDCPTMFINIETDRGLLQFVAYNDHNGYYGHHAVLISRQAENSEYL